MPLYDYECAQCGPFTELRPMAECEAPSDCPGCGAPAPRAWLTAPRLGGDPALIAAHAANERSAHAPQRAGHGPGCGCCAKQPSPAAKGFVGRRPWMISH